MTRITKSWQTGSIHDYFFVKTLDKLRPGGVLAFITSRYTMDKKDGDIREYLCIESRFARRDPSAEHVLQGQCRNRRHDRHYLPAKTRSRAGAGRPRMAEASRIMHRRYEGGAFSLNEYYVQKPEMMLGTMKLVHSRYGKQPELIGELTQEALEDAIAAAAARRVRAAHRRTDAAPVPPLISDEGAFTGVKNGAYVIVDNVLGIRQDGEFTPSTLKAKGRGAYARHDEGQGSCPRRIPDPTGRRYR